VFRRAIQNQSVIILNNLYFGVMLLLGQNTGVDINFDWRRGGKMKKKYCDDVILVTFFGDEMAITSPK